jgi:hypothetical protein
VVFGIFGKSVELPVLNGTYAGRIVGEAQPSSGCSTKDENSSLGLRFTVYP